MTMHDVMPGITLMFNDFTNVWNLESGFTLIRIAHALPNYCREGRMSGSGTTSCCLNHWMRRSVVSRL